MHDPHCTPSSCCASQCILPRMHSQPPWAPVQSSAPPRLHRAFPSTSSLCVDARLWRKHANLGFCQGPWEDFCSPSTFTMSGHRCEDGLRKEESGVGAPSHTHVLFSTGPHYWPSPLPSLPGHSHCLNPWSFLPIYGKLWFLCVSQPYVTFILGDPTHNVGTQEDPGPTGLWLPPLHRLSCPSPTPVMHTHTHMLIKQKPLHEHLEFPQLTLPQRLTPSCLPPWLFNLITVLTGILRPPPLPQAHFIS